MANINAACNPDLVDHLRATDIAKFEGQSLKKSVPINFGVKSSSIEVNRITFLSLHQAQENGFCGLTSRNKQRKILTNHERGI